LVLYFLLITFSLGPRYFISISKHDHQRIQESAKKSSDVPSKLNALFSFLEQGQLEADEVTLRKIRKLVRFNDLNQEQFQIEPTFMVIGTVMVAVGWAMLASAGAGTNHMLSNHETR